VLYRLDTPALHATAAPSVDVTPEVDIAVLAERERDAARMYAEGTLTKDQLTVVNKSIQEQRRAHDLAAARGARQSELDLYKAHPGQLRAEWPMLPLTRQNALIRLVLDHAVISAGRPGSAGNAVDRFHPVWRI
jgi:site-specific DNA recombinase